MLHEMLHLDLVANSDDNNPNPRIRDLKMQYIVLSRDDEPKTIITKVYRPKLAKIMARYLPFGASAMKTGYFTQRNDDNYVYFALAKYVQEKINTCISSLQLS